MKLGGGVSKPWDGQRVDPQGADRVEHADAVDRHPAGPGDQELLARFTRPMQSQPAALLPCLTPQHLKLSEGRLLLAGDPFPPVRGGFHPRPFIAMATEDLVRVPELFGRDRRATAEQPAFRDQADQGTGGEGATAETEDVDLVFVAIVLDQPVVCMANVSREAETERTARDTVEQAGADTLLVVNRAAARFLRRLLRPPPRSGSRGDRCSCRNRVGSTSHRGRVSTSACVDLLPP